MPTPLLTARIRAALCLGARHEAHYSWREIRGERVISGSMDGSRLRIYAMRPGVGNSWRRLLVADVAAGPQGCVVVGQLRWHRFVSAFTRFVLGYLAFFFVLVLGALVTNLLEPGQNDPRKLVAGLGFLVLFTASLIGLISLGVRWGQTDERHLLDWLSRQMNDAADPPIR